MDGDELVDWFLEHRMPDGGWNCEWVNGSVVSSFHSTLGALRALLDHERTTGDRDRVRDARRSGAEYLLSRGLLHRASTGELVGPWAVHLTYPHRRQYSVLDAAHHLRAAALHDGTPPDPACPRRSSCSAPAEAPTAAGSRTVRTRAGCGSTSTSPRGSPRGG